LLVKKTKECTICVIVIVHTFLAAGFFAAFLAAGFFALAAFLTPAAAFFTSALGAAAFARGIL